MSGLCAALALGLLPTLVGLAHAEGIEIAELHENGGLPFQSSVEKTRELKLTIPKWQSGFSLPALKVSGVAGEVATLQIFTKKGQEIESKVNGFTKNHEQVFANFSVKCKPPENITLAEIPIVAASVGGRKEYSASSYEAECVNEFGEHAVSHATMKVIGPEILTPGQEVTFKEASFTVTLPQQWREELLTNGAAEVTGRSSTISSAVMSFATRPTYAGFSATNQPPYAFLPYSSASFWNRKVSATEETELAPHSKEYVEKLFEWQPKEPAPLNLHVGEDEEETANDFGHPVYWASTTDPPHLLEGTEERNNHKAPISGETIRIPAGAKPAGIGAEEPDGHMVIVQPNGMEYDLWRASTPESEKPVAFSWGSKIHIYGNGQEEEENGMKRKGEATAADFPLMGGIIRPQELAAHKINHALFVVGHELKGMVWPATAEFQCKEPPMHCEPKGTPPKMGARIWLKYSDQEITEKKLPAWKQTIAIALHEYGGYIGDSGGNAEEARTWGLEVESPESTLSFNASNDPMKAYIEEEFLAGGASERCGSATHFSISSFRHSSWPTGTCAYQLHLNEREAPREGEEEKLNWREGIEVLEPPPH